MEILAIIPARGGSKGIPKKNVKAFCGHPLIAWTIGQCKRAQRITRTVVSTDDGKIAEVAKQYGAEVPFLRPEEYAGDSSKSEEALLHTVETLQKTESYTPDAVIMLQPTSPIRFDGLLDNAITTWEGGSYDSVLSVYEGHHFFWKNAASPQALYNFTERPMRQDIPEEERLYAETGSIYVTKTSALLEARNRLSGKIGVVQVSTLENFDIDTEEDWQLLEALQPLWKPRVQGPATRV